MKRTHSLIDTDPNSQSFTGRGTDFKTSVCMPLTLNFILLTSADGRTGGPIILQAKSTHRAGSSAAWGFIISFESLWVDCMSSYYYFDGHMHHKRLKISAPGDSIKSLYT